MKHSGSIFILAAATIALGALVGITAPAALAEPTSGTVSTASAGASTPTVSANTGNASRKTTPTGQITGRPQTLVFKIGRFH